IDNNIGDVNNNPMRIFTDPDTRAPLNDPFAGNVYVAWGTNNQPFTNAPGNFKPTTIQMVVSSDGGQSFSTPIQVDNPGHVGSDRNAFPRLTVSQGTLPAGGAGGTQRPTAPGQVSLVWDDFGSGNNVDRIVSNHV